MPSLLGTGPRTRRDHHGPTAALTTLACHCHGRPPSTRHLQPSARKPSRRIPVCIVFLSPSTSPCLFLSRPRARIARLTQILSAASKFEAAVAVVVRANRIVSAFLQVEL